MNKKERCFYTSVQEMLFSRLDRFLNTLNHCLDIVLGFLCLLLSKVVLMEVYNFLD